MKHFIGRLPWAMAVMAHMAHAAAFVQLALDFTTPEDEAQVRRRALTVIQGGKACEPRALAR